MVDEIARLIDLSRKPTHELENPMMQTRDENWAARLYITAMMTSVTIDTFTARVEHRSPLHMFREATGNMPK